MTNVSEKQHFEGSNGTVYNNSDIGSRSQKWIEHREQKRGQLKEKESLKQKEICTFKPELVTSGQSSHLRDTDYSKLNGKAISKFLERQNRAKMLKEEQEAYN